MRRRWWYVALLVMIVAARVSGQEIGPIAVTVPGTPDSYTAETAVIESASAQLAGQFAAVLVTTLQLAGDRPVRRVDYLLPELNPDTAGTVYQELGFETAVFGSLESSGDGEWMLHVGIWSPTDSVSREVTVTPDTLATAAASVAAEVLGAPVELGTLRIDGAEHLGSYAVYADQTLIARSSSEVPIVVGTYRITVATPTVLGDQPVLVEDATIRPGAVTQVAIETEASTNTGDLADDAAVDRSVATGSLRVQASIPGVQVTLDGNALGVTPLERVGIPEGRYQLVLSAPGFRDQVVLAEIVPGGVESLDLRMEADLSAPGVREHQTSSSAASFAALAGIGMKMATIFATWNLYGDPIFFDSPTYFAGSLVSTLPALGLAVAGDRRGSWIAGSTYAASHAFSIALIRIGQLELDRPLVGTLSGMLYSVGMVLETVLLFGASVAEIVTAPGRAEETNARLLEQIESTGTLPEKVSLRRRFLSAEAGGGSIGRVLYHQPLVADWLVVEAGGGATLVAIDPVRAAPQVVGRVLVRPFGVPYGALNVEFLAEAVAETNLSSIGFTVAAGTGPVLQLRSLDIYLQTTARYGLTSGSFRSAMSVGMRL